MDISYPFVRGLMGEFLNKVRIFLVKTGGLGIDIPKGERRYMRQSIRK